MPSITQAERMNAVPFSGIRRIFDEATRLEQSGMDMIHLEIGRPDFDTPAHIKAAAKSALDRGEVHYTANTGTPALRRAIAQKLKEDNGLDYDPGSEIIVTVGASEAVYLAATAFLNAGEEFLAPSIGWVNYYSVPAILSARVASYPVREENGFQVKAADIESSITGKTRMLLLVSPGNPTGAVVAAQDLAEIAEVVRRHNLVVISDEIYEKIIYDGARHLSIASMPGMRERTIVVNGFSKAYSMTGWRLGYTASPRELAAPMVRVHQYLTTCAVAFAQAGAVAALEGSQECVATMVAEFKRRRDMLVPALNRIPGVTCTMPRGAFYVFANVSSFGKSSDEIAMYLLREAGVATVPGSAMGPGAEGYIRLSYANSYEKIEQATQRMETAFSKLTHQ